MDEDSKILKDFKSILSEITRYKNQMPSIVEMTNQLIEQRANTIEISTQILKCQAEIMEMNKKLDRNDINKEKIELLFKDENVIVLFGKFYAKIIERQKNDIDKKVEDTIIGIIKKNKEDVCQTFMTYIYDKISLMIGKRLIAASFSISLLVSIAMIIITYIFKK